MHQIHTPSAIATLGLSKVNVEQGRGVQAKSTFGIASVEPRQRRIHFDGQRLDVFGFGFGRNGLDNGFVRNGGFFHSQIHTLRIGVGFGDFSQFQFSVSNESDLQAVLGKGGKAQGSRQKTGQAHGASRRTDRGGALCHSLSLGGVEVSSVEVESTGSGGFSSCTRRS